MDFFGGFGQTRCMKKTKAIPANAILVLHGPNLNLLGTREPEVYGTVTLGEINRRLAKLATGHDTRLETYQSNSEAELIERIQRARDDGTGFIIINPAAFTHTSVALRDALAASKHPFVKSIFPTSSPASRFAANPISPIWRWVW